MTEVSTMRIERKTSIENEPRTLDFQQIQSARDAALYVVKTRSLEEANQIFTKGMSPITSAESKKATGEASDVYFDAAENEDNNNGNNNGGGKFPLYRNQQFGLLGRAEEVLTAPF